MAAESLPPSDREMSLSDHLRELRNRLIVVIAVTLVLMLGIFPFAGELVDGVLKQVVPAYVKITTYAPLELFKARLTICFIGALAIGFPLLVYEAFRFSSPGLYPHEKRFLYLIFPFSLLLFIAGGLIAYFVTLPLFFGLVIGQGAGVASPELSVGQTFSVVTNFILGFGVVFQLPLIVVMAIKMRLVKRETLVKGRLAVYGLLFGVAMFMSPDPTLFSQLIVLAVLAVLFELSMVLARFI